MFASTGSKDHLLDLVGGHRITAVLYSAVALGVIEALDSGAGSAAEVAAACSTSEGATERLLAALATAGIVSKSASAYRLTDMGLRLTGRAPRSLRDWTLFEGEMLARSWQGLTESVRSGKTSTELDSQAGGRFEAIGRDPRFAELFDNAMVSITRHVAQDVIAAHDFSTAHAILDVGGGTGALLIDILRAVPGLTGAALDLPRCEAGFRAAVAAAGLAQRTQFFPGDFFEGVPQGFKTLVLKSVLHNWDDARCASILANCRRVLPPDGRVVVVERLLPEPPANNARDMSIMLSDLNMLRGPGGRERTERAYRELLGNAGFVVGAAVPAGRYNVLVGEL
jgi:ubiquinone/menaquinone biosynthesis C-methylase UbiE